MAIGTDDHLQNIDTANYRHRWLSSWMTTGMAPVTTSTADYRHGWLSSRMTTFMAPVTIGTANYRHGWPPSEHRQEHRHKLLTYQIPAWMATFTDPVTIGMADYRHGWENNKYFYFYTHFNAQKKPNYFSYLLFAFSLKQCTGKKTQKPSNQARVIP